MGVRTRSILHGCSAFVAGAALILLGVGFDSARAAPATVVLTNSAFRPLAVGPAGTGWAYRAAAPNELWRSEDEARTWARVTGWDPIGRRPWYITPLSTGTLLAAYDTGSSWAIARSADYGASWTQVLRLPCIASNCTTRYTTLTAQSIAEGGGDVFVGTYNNASGQPWPNHIYRSSDDGVTWFLAGTTSTHRHIHGLSYDHMKRRLYVMFGDRSGDGVWYSTDRGATLQPLCTEYKCVAISAIVDPADGAHVVFGTDNPNVLNRIVKLDTATGQSTDLFTMAYTSYSSLRAGSTMLVAETHESGVAITDPSIHVYASSDGGATWGIVYELAIPSTASNNRLQAIGVFPSGDILLQASSQGTVVLRPDTTPTTAQPPANTALPKIVGTPRQGETLTASAGTWTGSPPLAFAYQWRRCETDESGCVDISGATQTQLLLTAADVDATIRMHVRASNGAGAASADSLATAVVEAPPPALQPPVNLSAPVVTGHAAVGGQLSGSAGSWSGSQPLSFAYQWHRCAPGGYAQAVLADAPRGYWRLDETAGTQALDSSGQGRHGTYLGGVVLGAAGALPGSLAGSFDGIDDQVEVPGTSALSPPRLTVEAWVRSKTVSWDDYGYFVSKRTSYVLHPRRGSHSVDFIVVVGGSERAARWAPPTGFDITQWHHYVGSYDGTQVRLYVDGVLRAQLAASGNASPDGGPLYIGRDDGWPRYGAAFIDEVAVYDKALSDARIAAHAQGSGDGGCSPIDGATGSSYTPTTADLGQRLRLTVTASNSVGSASASSNDTAEVTAPPGLTSRGSSR